MERIYNIKPIPTTYKHRQFRSRLEARFAVFFDAIKLRWSYEVQGYNLGSELGWYLPDFSLSVGGGNIHYIEVKPTYPTMTEIRKMQTLCRGRMITGCILFGDVAPPAIDSAALQELIQSGDTITHKDILNNISGALMIQFSKEGFILPDYEVFAAIDGADRIGMWTLYLNPEKTFGPKQRMFSSSGKLVEGVKVLAISTPYSTLPGTTEMSKELTHTRIYSGKGVSYNSEKLVEAYEKASSAFK